MQIPVVPHEKWKLQFLATVSDGSDKQHSTLETLFIKKGWLCM